MQCRTCKKFLWSAEAHKLALCLRDMGGGLYEIADMFHTTKAVPENFSMVTRQF